MSLIAICILCPRRGFIEDAQRQHKECRKHTSETGHNTHHHHPIGHRHNAQVATNEDENEDDYSLAVEDVWQNDLKKEDVLAILDDVKQSEGPVLKYDLSKYKKEYGIMELSIGDYILSGGEIAAQVFVDSCVRLLDNVVHGGDDTTQNESFEIGGLEWPLYTRPSVWRGQSVPEVLLSGHHGNIERWRKQQSVDITKERRPDLIKENEK